MSQSKIELGSVKVESFSAVAVLADQKSRGGFAVAMKTRRMVLCLHAASLVTGYALVVLAYFIEKRGTFWFSSEAEYSIEDFTRRFGDELTTQVKNRTGNGDILHFRIFRRKITRGRRRGTFYLSAVGSAVNS
jgi:hypothetical protein